MGHLAMREKGTRKMAEKQRESLLGILKIMKAPWGRKSSRENIATVKQGFSGLAGKLNGVDCSDVKQLF